MTRILSNQTEKYMRREMILFSSSHHDQLPTTRMLTYFSIKLHIVGLFSRALTIWLKCGTS